MIDKSYILNITNLNVEKEIQNTIKKVIKELDGLDVIGTCQIYSSYIQRDLQHKHIVSKLLNTKELGCDYEHYFIVAKDGVNDYLIDLTYSQFGWNEPDGLVQGGYMKITESELHNYLGRISGIKNCKK